MKLLLFGNALAFALLLPASTNAAPVAPITLEVDARDVTQGIQHAHLTIPVHSGLITLAYPKWIPGEHAADGPLTQMASLQIKAGDRVVSWRRDAIEPFSFHVDVPAGVSLLDVRFDYLSPPKVFADGYGKTPNATPHLLLLPFNHFILYPQEAVATALQIKAEILIPAGWKFDGALHPEAAGNGRISLPVTSLYTLVDSPILAGEYFRSIPLTTGTGPTRISIAADAPADLAMSDTMIDGMRHVVSEANALFGAGHYHEYVWLVALGNILDPQNGLEHHESTDIRDSESLFLDADRLVEARTLPHEYVHSWNGKYRRPAGLATRNYQQPMVDDLLWVYEGMTRYLGDFVLRARSGLSSPEQIRAYVAWIASALDAARPGRSWRSLADTAIALPAFNDAPGEWSAIRRKRDYYDEMLLVWLEADMLIRQSTGGRRSMDDFCRDFFGGAAGAPAVKPYSRADLVQALHAWLKSDGTVVDIVNGSPAFAAGVAPAMQVIAIAGRKWSIANARSALVDAEKTPQTIELIVDAGDLVRTLRVDYHGGLRNPHLTRIDGTPDAMSQIIAPKAPR